MKPNLALAQELLDRLGDARIVRSGPARIDTELKNDLVKFLEQISESIANEAANERWRESYKYILHSCDLVWRDQDHPGCPHCHLSEDSEGCVIFRHDCDCEAYGFCGYAIAMAAAAE